MQRPMSDTFAFSDMAAAVKEATSNSKVDANVNGNHAVHVTNGVAIESSVHQRPVSEIISKDMPKSSEGKYFQSNNDISYFICILLLL